MNNKIPALIGRPFSPVNKKPANYYKDTKITRPFRSTVPIANREDMSTNLYMDYVDVRWQYHSSGWYERDTRM